MIPSYVKFYPKFFSLFGAKGFAIMPLKTIFLKEDIFNDLKTKNPNPQGIAILKHEEEHLKRLSDENIFKYILKYYFSPKFRLEEELVAYRKQFSYLKKFNLQYDLEKVAKDFSGIFYLHATSYEKAKRLLLKTWSEA